MTLLAFALGVLSVGFLIGYVWRGVEDAPPPYISGCVSTQMHHAGRECPACGPDRAA